MPSVRYFSPYPEEITRGYTRLFICEYTLKPIASPVHVVHSDVPKLTPGTQLAIKRHRVKNKVRHPPGEEIYRYDAPGPNGVKQVSFWEIDGAREKIYCQVGLID